MSLWRFSLPASLAALVLCAGSVDALTPSFSNGDFETGSLAGWTTYTTTRGTLGPAGFPDVQLFDVTGGGATLAVRFNVGDTLTPRVAPEGGGLRQSLILDPGVYSLSANIAAIDSPSGPNAEMGLFSVLVNGTIVGTTNLGESPGAGLIARGTLKATFPIVVAGAQDFRFQIARSYLSSGVLSTPQQFIDNIQLAPVPEPSLAIVFGTAAWGWLWVLRRHS